MNPYAMVQWLKDRAERDPNRRALTYYGTTWTYGEFWRRIVNAAAVLSTYGIRKGDRIGYLGHNHSSTLLSVFAASYLGAVFVPLNFRLADPELVRIVTHSGIRVLICDDLGRTFADRNPDELADLVLLGADGTSGLDEDIDSASGVDRIAVSSAEVDSNDPALVMYTSGSTGRPKGVILTHNNIWANSVAWGLTIGSERDDVQLIMSPLFHVAGMTSGTMNTLQKGGEIILLKGFEAGEFLQVVEDFRVTVVQTVTTIMTMISQHPNFATTDLSTLRYIQAGGAPIPLATLELFMERGASISLAYGATEATAHICILNSEFMREKIGSPGKPVMSTELRIMGLDGEFVTEPDTVGEVYLRGPSISPGYWNDPEGTAAAFDSDGWFHTGDLGRVDADGFVYLVDRAKDMIISGGENVYSVEVEAVLVRHPAVRDVAVIGTPHEKWGEGVTAIVTCEEGATLTLDEIREWGKGQIAGFKLPVRLEIVREMPRTAAGKIQKTVLREEFGATMGTKQLTGSGR